MKTISALIFILLCTVAANNASAADKQYQCVGAASKYRAAGYLDTQFTSVTVMFKDGQWWFMRNNFTQQLSTIPDREFAKKCIVEVMLTTVTLLGCSPNVTSYNNNVVFPDGGSVTLSSAICQ